MRPAWEEGDGAKPIGMKLTLPKLRTLHLATCSIGSAMPLFIAAPDLRTLTVSEIKGANDFLLGIADNYHELEEINARCGLAFLDALGNTCPDAATLARKLPNLRVVRLSATPNLNDRLAIIKRFPRSLKLLDIRHCHMPYNSTPTVQLYLPETEILGDKRGVSRW